MPKTGKKREGTNAGSVGQELGSCNRQEKGQS